MVGVVGWHSEYCRMANFFHGTIFPNFSFLGVSVSNISEERTYIFFRFYFFPFYVD